MNLPGVANYICGHNMLKAHAKVYHMYQEEFKEEQNGLIGIANECNSFFAKNQTDTLQDEAFQFTCGWFSHPIFSKQGDYPPVMRKLINHNSIRDGWPNSRLPTFSKEWINYIKLVKNSLPLEIITRGQVIRNYILEALQTFTL